MCLKILSWNSNNYAAYSLSFSNYFSFKTILEELVGFEGLCMLQSCDDFDALV